MLKELLNNGGSANAMQDHTHPIQCCINNIIFYTNSTPAHLNLNRTSPYRSNNDVKSACNMACFIELICNGARYNIDDEYVAYTSRNKALYEHKHFSIFSSISKQDYYNNLFNKIKQRWWVTKIFRSKWYENSMKTVYKPVVGKGYQKCILDLQSNKWFI